MKTKNKKSILLAVLMLLLFSFQSCGFDVNAIKGNGNLQSVEKNVTYFDAIKASGMFKIYLEEGDVPFVRIDTDENIHEYIKLEVKGNTLEISMERNQTYNPTRLEVYITVNHLRKLELSGATSLSASHIISAEELVMEMSGASDVNMMVDVQKLETIVSGAGSINIEGNAAYHKVRLSGAASLKCVDLITRETSINLSGAGSADVHATEKIDASISGVGSIKYAGNPSSTSFSKSGLGSIKPI